MPNRVRLKVDTGTKKTLDVLTSGTPSVWKSSALNIEFGIFYNDAIRSLADFSSVSLLLKKEGRRGANLIEVVVAAADLNNSLTSAEWDAGTLAHGTAELSALDLTLDLDGDKRTFWIAIVGTDSTTDEPVMLGGCNLTIEESGILLTSSGPTQGANLIPPGAVYNGSGQYTLAVTADVLHSYSKGANDTSVTNGTETISATGQFTSQGASVVLNGTIGAAITAVIRYPIYPSFDQIRAILGTDIIRATNPAGRSILLVSPDGSKGMILACDNNEQFTTTPISIP